MTFFGCRPLRVARWLLAGTCASAAVVAHAQTSVVVTPEKVSVSATRAPLSEVLDRLARQTGMKLVYEGTAPPRQPITAQFERSTAVEAVLSLLEGQGLNYALRLDASGTTVETLMMLGSAGSGARTPVATRPTPPRRPAVPDVEPEEPTAEAPPDVEAAAPEVPPEGEPAEPPEPPGTPAGPINPVPPGYSVSPFAPQGPVPGVVFPSAPASPQAPSPQPGDQPSPEPTN